MCYFLVLVTSLIITINSLCSWDRHVQPATGNNNAETVNFINGQWTLESNTFNGQNVWSKTISNCYVLKLYLYYWKPNNIDDEYKWLVAGSIGSTPGSAYAVCNQSPQPTDPTKCFGEWYFAPDGSPDSNFLLYTKDQFFYFMPGDCPQVLCNSVEYTSSSGNDIWEGTYNRISTKVNENQNVYLMTPAASSSTNKFYLYFNELIFKWIINENLDYDCQKATDGQLTAVSTVNSWGSSSNIAGEFWYFVPDVSSIVRLITCEGKIPTISPSKSDATGYPTAAPTVYQPDCQTFPSLPACQPTAPTTHAPSISPTTPTVSWPTYPTVPTEPPVDVPSNGNRMYCKMCFIVIFLLYTMFW